MNLILAIVLFTLGIALARFNNIEMDFSKFRTARTLPLLFFALAGGCVWLYARETSQVLNATAVLLVGGLVIAPLYIVWFFIHVCPLAFSEKKERGDTVCSIMLNLVIIGVFVVAYADALHIPRIE